MPAVAMKWWQSGVIYQIYPRSFRDSNGDGVGDLPGIALTLPYLQWLGVDAIWISPVFPSPMADFGYDVSDYTGIDPLFGTLDDFRALLAEARRRGIRVILDYVPNHTSSQHPWFVESRSSREGAKRDWYIWRDPAPDGSPPNNWRSVFGGSAWTFDERTGQFYYHAFLKEQPDLNWRNPDVRAAMFDVLRFWLDLGVDGFRVDVIWHLMKDGELRNNPSNPDLHRARSPYYELLPIYSCDQPEIHELVESMRALVDSYGDRVLIGEIYLPLEKLITYYGREGGGVHLPYNFQLISLPWQARTIAAAVDAYEALLPRFAWPNWVLGNHDKPRIASRAGEAQARVAAMLLLTLRGTPTIYYGDELGMRDVPIPPELEQDPYGKNVPGRGLGRDPVRTPMQWSAEPHGGFSSGKPWLPLAHDYRTVNVAAERNDPASMLTLHRRLIQLRREHPALHRGAYAPMASAGDVIAFVRKEERALFLIVLNLGGSPALFDLPSHDFHGHIVLSTHLDREGEAVKDSLSLRADEGVLIGLG
ncbi:MAG TPA: alpha-amylase family glycosyl hydrolase [Thermoanaerobaculia bacterium]|nr:alpha-amylase family glycosyl hydrolase [Thermoanaerobaculia bacterium]